MRKMIAAGAIAMLLGGCVASNLDKAADAVEAHGYSDVTVWDGPTSGCSLLLCHTEFAATAPNGRRVSGTLEVIKAQGASVIYVDTGTPRAKPDSTPREIGVPQ